MILPRIGDGILFFDDSIINACFGKASRGGESRDTGSYDEGIRFFHKAMKGFHILMNHKLRIPRWLALLSSRFIRIGRALYRRSWRRRVDFTSQTS